MRFRPLKKSEKALPYHRAKKLLYLDKGGLLRYVGSSNRKIYNGGDLIGVSLLRLRAGKGKRYTYLPANLVWLLSTQLYPKYPLVYKDGDTSNIHISNLLDRYADQRRGYRPLFEHETYRTFLIYRKLWKLDKEDTNTI